MKKSELRELIREELLKEAKDYWRLPKNVIGNVLYPLTFDINALYKSVNKGNDLNIEHLESIVTIIESIRKSAKRFKAGIEPDKGY